MLRCCQHAMRKVRGDFGAELRAFTGDDDHLHLLAAMGGVAGGWRGRPGEMVPSTSARML